MCVLDMRREFQVVVSNFELFCLSEGPEIVVSTFYVFYLSRSLSECDKIDHMITYISQNEVGLLDIQTQILTTGIRSGGERNAFNWILVSRRGVGTFLFVIITNTHTLTFTYRCMMSRCYWKRSVMWKCLLLFPIPVLTLFSIQKSACWKGM